LAYRDLRDFIAQLEAAADLVRVRDAVDPNLEMTALCDRALRARGPALLFEHPAGRYAARGGATIPVLGNLFGTTQRVALGMGEESVAALREVGKLLAFLKEPAPPKGLLDAWQNLPRLRDPDRFEAWAYRLIVNACNAEAREPQSTKADTKAKKPEKATE